MMREHSTRLLAYLAAAKTQREDHLHSQVSRSALLAETIGYLGRSVLPGVPRPLIRSHGLRRCCGRIRINGWPHLA